MSLGKQGSRRRTADPGFFDKLFGNEPPNDSGTSPPPRSGDGEGGFFSSMFTAKDPSPSPEPHRRSSSVFFPSPRNPEPTREPPGFFSSLFSEKSGPPAKPPAGRAASRHHRRSTWASSPKPMVDNASTKSLLDSALSLIAVSPKKDRRGSFQSKRKESGFFTSLMDVMGLGDDDETIRNLPEDESTTIDLAFRKILCLPKVPEAKARRIVRIDMTETGVQRLSGLLQFPNLRTLVLDNGGLPSLPQHCPVVPSLQTLSFNNNAVRALTPFIAQVARCFPNLTYLSLLGNPVWPGLQDFDSEEAATAADLKYRIMIASRLPRLVTLDTRDITREERTKADAAEVLLPSSGPNVSMLRQSSTKKWATLWQQEVFSPEKPERRASPASPSYLSPRSSVQYDAPPELGRQPSPMAKLGRSPRQFGVGGGSGEVEARPTSPTLTPSSPPRKAWSRLGHRGESLNRFMEQQVSVKASEAEAVFAVDISDVPHRAGRRRWGLSDQEKERANSVRAIDAEAVFDVDMSDQPMRRGSLGGSSGHSGHRGRNSLDVPALVFEGASPMASPVPAKGASNGQPRWADAHSRAVEPPSPSPRTAPVRLQPPMARGGRPKWGNPAIVLDVGTGVTKAGFAGDDMPACVFPTVLGFPGGGAGGDQACYVGEECLPFPGRKPPPAGLQLVQPLEAGMVKDWEHMEKLWQYAMEGALGAQAGEHPVLLSDSVGCPPSTRESTAEIMFECFNVPAVYMSCQAVLSLYACGVTSGLVLDVGEGGSRATPVHQGFVLEGTQNLAISGWHVTFHLANLLNKSRKASRKFRPDDLAQQMELRGVKEHVCYVSKDKNRDDARLESKLSTQYTLPDGIQLKVARERYNATEVLFNPSLAGLRGAPSLHAGVVAALSACEPDLRTTLASNIVVTGGTSELAGMSRRLTKELLSLSKPEEAPLPYEVLIPENSRYAVWLGGSILASLDTFQELWVSRQEYEEQGARVVHEKCVP